MNVFDLQATLSLDTSGYDKGLNNAANTAKKAGSNIGSIFGGTLASNLATQGINAIMSGTQAAIGSISNLTQSAVDSYAQYEQLVGGVDKLYGEASAKVQAYADEAYKTSGMSANQYMETATSFSASLIQSLGGDVNQAAEMTDVAMRAMSDNVNTFGSSMESVTNAFQGFAKGNYTMLDNLKLGYGGTKTEMERLIADAEKLNDTFTAQRDEEGNLLLNFADIITAIQTVQEAQNIAGTTNKEAMSTIEGSAMATKAAWENVITAIGRGEGLDEALDGLLNSLFGGENGGGLIENMLPRIATAIKGFGVFFERIVPVITEKLPGLVSTLVPVFVSAIKSLFVSISNSNLPQLATILLDSLKLLAEDVIEELPNLLQNAISTVIGVLESLADFAPSFIPLVVSTLAELVQIIIDNADLLIAAAIGLLEALVVGITESLPILLEAAPQLIASLTAALFSSAYRLMMAGYEIIVQILVGLADALPSLSQATGELIPLMCTELLDQLPELIVVGLECLGAIVSGIVEAVPTLLYAVFESGDIIRTTFANVFKEYNWKELGENIVQGILDGVGALASMVTDAANNIASNFLETTKKALGIHSPSTIMRDVIGKNMMLGWQEGIDENAPSLQGVVDDMMVEPKLSLSSEGIGGIGMTLAGSLNGLQVVAPIYIGNTLLDTFVTDAITRQEYISGGR